MSIEVSVFRPKTGKVEPFRRYFVPEYQLFLAYYIVEYASGSLKLNYKDGVHFLVEETEFSSNSKSTSSGELGLASISEKTVSGSFAEDSAKEIIKDVTKSVFFVDVDEEVLDRVVSEAVKRFDNMVSSISQALIEFGDSFIVESLPKSYKSRVSNEEG